MLRAVARTAARRTALPVARRQVNLAALEAKVTSDEGKSELSRLKMALGEAALLAQKYGSEPPAIDFGAYKGKVDDALLALAEKEYAAVSYPAFAELDAAKAEYDALFAEAAGKVGESKTRIDELTKQMNTMVAKKVGPATTVEDVYEAYPDIEAEIDEEIDTHQWAKDV